MKEETIHLEHGMHLRADNMDKDKLLQEFWDRVIEVSPDDIKSETIKIVSDKDIEWLIEKINKE